MLKQSFAFLLLCCTLVSPATWSSEEVSAEVLLGKMKTAFNSLNYDLSYVELEKGRITPMRYSHGVVDGVSTGHFLSLNGNPREYLRRGDVTSFFEAEQQSYSLKSVNIPGLLFKLMATELTGVEKDSYEAVFVGGRSRITGRVSQVVRVVPKDKYRFGYLLWIDMKTSLPLRVDMIQNSGEVVYQIMAVSLYQFPSITPWIEQMSKSKMPTILTMRPSDKVKESEWKTTWLPSGFTMVSNNKHQVAGIGQEVSYLQYSDGLVDVSVYINSDPQSGSLTQGLGVSGQISLQSKITDDVEIVVVGEIPVMTAKKIANSVIRNIR